MANILLVTNKRVLSDQVEQLRRDQKLAKIVYHFGELFDPRPILDLAWPDNILFDDEIDAEVKAALGSGAEPLGRHVYVRRGNGPAGVPDRPRGTILLVPCNDTHVKMMLPLAKLIPSYHFLLIRGENADKYLDEHGESYSRMEFDLFKNDRYRPKLEKLLVEKGVTAVVFGNDWTGENWRICHVARELGIPSVCIQEGPQDYELDGGKWRQMQYADYIFSQGAITLQYLDAPNYVLTGNPRLTHYRPVPLPEKPVVMINSNFTYGVFEDVRDRWVGDCVAACKELGLEYFISQHPRDNGKFSDYNVIPSDAFKIIDQINRSSVIITRFSQVLYEGMLSGRQGIYYNPHGEVKKVLTEDRSGAFFHAADRLSLTAALAEAVRPVFANAAERERFLKLHCGPCDHREAERCVKGLAGIVEFHLAGTAPAAAPTSRPPSGLSDRLRRFLQPQAAAPAAPPPAPAVEPPAAAAPAAIASRTFKQVVEKTGTRIKPMKSQVYFDVYDELFATMRLDPLRILEVGILHGGSVLMFAEYFEKARLMSIDINPPPRPLIEACRELGYDDRVFLEQGSQDDIAFLRRTLDAHFGDQPLDVVIDDASHLYQQTLATFNYVFHQRLKPGGIYIVEDWGCGYWPKWYDGNPDGQHGLPKFVKEMIDELAMFDRTKEFQGARALNVEKEVFSSIKKILVNPGVLVMFKSERPGR